MEVVRLDVEPILAIAALIAPVRGAVVVFWYIRYFILGLLFVLIHCYHPYRLGLVASLAALATFAASSQVKIYSTFLIALSSASATDFTRSLFANS